MAGQAMLTRWFLCVVAVAFIGACDRNGGSSESTNPESAPMVLPPVIAQSPLDAIVAPGQPASFFVDVTGTGPFAFQWFRDGQPIGLSDSTYAISVAQRSDSGSTFYVVVSNFGGKVQSSTATLTVTGPPR